MKDSWGNIVDSFDYGNPSICPFGGKTFLLHVSILKIKQYYDIIIRRIIDYLIDLTLGLENHRL